MQIWYELDQAGAAGLTFDEILEKVSPRVPAGYAWRRYLRQRQAQHNHDQRQASSEYGSASPYSEPVDTPAARRKAVLFVVRASLSSMVQSGTALKRPDGHFAVLRKPKSAFSCTKCGRDEHDYDGSVTRKEVALMEWLRTWRVRVAEIDTQWIPTHQSGDMPTLRVAEYAAIKRLVEAHTKTQ
jgi:hypothetical protein